MKKESIIKLILIIFFLILFSFLFWYFYKPTEEGTFIEKIKNDVSFFPFGNNIFNDTTDNKNNNSDKPIEIINNKEVEMPRLRQISKQPTAGVYFGLLNAEEIVKYNRTKSRKQRKINEDDNISEIRYILSKNGHIFNTFTDSLKETRISNITIPKIYETVFFDKNNFIIRYLNNTKNIKTYSIVLAEKSPEELKIEREQNKEGEIDKNLRNFDGVFFPNDILKVAKSPHESKVFYLKEFLDENNISGIVTNNWADNKQKIHNFDFKEWNIQWVNKNEILFTSLPSKNTYSISMILNIKDKSFHRISKPLLAGSALANHNLSKILYSGIYQGKYTLLIYDRDTNIRKPLGVNTLVDKCIWSKNNIDVYCAVPESGLGTDQPDAWYRGYNYFTDSIYKINTELGFTNLVYLNNKNYNFDILELHLDESENFLYWIDKRTDFAWSYLIHEKIVEPPVEEVTEPEEEIVEEKTLGAGKECSAEIILTQNLQAGDRNGKYSSWEKGVITEVKILQGHMNRLGFQSGPEDGILGPLTDGAIKRMQKFLGTYQDGKVGPITRGLINNSCAE